MLSIIYKIFNKFFDDSWLLSQFSLDLPYYNIRSQPPMQVHSKLLSSVRKCAKNTINSLSLYKISAPLIHKIFQVFDYPFLNHFKLFSVVSFSNFIIIVTITNIVIA